MDPHGAHARRAADDTVDVTRSGSRTAHAHAPRSPPPGDERTRTARALFMFFLSLLLVTPRATLEPILDCLQDSSNSKIRPPFHAPPRGVYGVATSSLLTSTIVA